MNPTTCVVCTDIIEDRKCKLQITIEGETREGYMCRKCYKEDLLS